MLMAFNVSAKVFYRSKSFFGKKSFVECSNSLAKSGMLYIHIRCHDSQLS